MWFRMLRHFSSLSSSLSLESPTQLTWLLIDCWIDKNFLIRYKLHVAYYKYIYIYTYSNPWLNFPKLLLLCYLHQSFLFTFKINIWHIIKELVYNCVLYKICQHSTVSRVIYLLLHAIRHKHAQSLAFHLPCRKRLECDDLSPTLQPNKDNKK